MKVREAFRRQAEVCAEMGSPFTARVCDLAADRLAAGDAVADRVLGWPGDPGTAPTPCRSASRARCTGW